MKSTHELVQIAAAASGKQAQLFLTMPTPRPHTSWFKLPPLAKAALFLGLVDETLNGIICHSNGSSMVAAEFSR